MHKFEFLRQPLLGELAMSPEERKKEREKNAICSGHLRLCQQPRAAHALRSDQLLYLNMVQFKMHKLLMFTFGLNVGKKT